MSNHPPKRLRFLPSHCPPPTVSVGRVDDGEVEGLAREVELGAAGAAADGTVGEDHDPESHLIPRVLQVALRQADRVTIFGNDYPTRDGTCVRDYIHVEDLASIHRLALERQEAGRFEAYNVGTGVGVSVLEVVEAARRVTGHDIPAQVAPRRPGDPPELVAQATAIRSRFDWQPKYTDIGRTMETAWNWHRSRPAGYGERSSRVHETNSGRG